MRKFCAKMLVLTLLAVSSLPVVGTTDADTGWCQQCHMSASEMAAAGHMHMTHVQAQIKRQVMPPAMRHCRIECCGHHDSVDGLPHLLAPHVAASHSLMPALVRLPAPAAMPAHPRRIWLALLSPPPERV